MQLKSQLQTVIESLKDAVKVNYQAIDDPDKGYPYAAGYSRLSLQNAALQLESIIEWYNSSDENDNEPDESTGWN
jgi:hypothetical protein